MSDNNPVVGAKREVLNEDQANKSKIKRLEILTKRGQHAPTPPQPAVSPGQATPEVMALSPNFKPSGLLELDKKDREANRIGQEYEEPEDKCTCERFRFYTFEDHDDIQNTIMLNQKSKYLVGSSSDNDIILDDIDPHQAVIQIRQLAGLPAPTIYLVDLGGSEGSMVNGKRIKSMEFVELTNKDTIKFSPNDKEFLLIEDV